MVASLPWAAGAAVPWPLVSEQEAEAISHLYRARADAKTGANVQLTVWQIHPDAGAPGTSKTFALGLVHAAPAAGGRDRAASPLQRAIIVGEVCDEAWMKAHAAAFIRTFSRKAIKNARVADLPLPARNAIWAQNDASLLPWARYELVATDPAWVQHLRVGSVWETAAYDMGAAAKAAPRRPGAPAPGAADDPAGFRAIKLTPWAQGTAKTKVEVCFHALDRPDRYSAEPVLRGDAIAKGLRSLLGKPIVLSYRPALDLPTARYVGTLGRYGRGKLRLLDCTGGTSVSYQDFPLADVVDLGAARSLPRSAGGGRRRARTT